MTGGNEYKLGIVIHGWWKQEVLENECGIIWPTTSGYTAPLKIGNQKLKTEAPTPMSTVVIKVYKGYNNFHTISTWMGGQDAWNMCTSEYLLVLTKVKFWFMYKIDCLLMGQEEGDKR